MEKVEKEKAEKEEAGTVQSQANELEAVPSQSHETTPMLDHGHDDGLAPAAPNLSLSNVVHAIGNRIRKKKQFMFPLASSSMIEPKDSFHVFVQCTSLITLLKSLQEPIGPDPRWIKLHDTIAKVLYSQPNSNISPFMPLL